MCAEGSVMKSRGSSQNCMLPHVPVMVDMVVDFFADCDDGGLLVDGTAGAGGHLAFLSEALPGLKFLAIDRDPAAVSILEDRFARNPAISIKQGSYTEIPDILTEMKRPTASAALFDLGLSSMQLDDPSRGFSYRLDGPLDMRFDDSCGITASELLNNMSEKDIADTIFVYGEEGRSRRIAREIVKNRPVRTTRELLEIIDNSVKGNSVKVLSRVFQALRIAVNKELDQLDMLVENMVSWTGTGAKIAFITFHSIEDRKIKLLFRDDPNYRQHSPKWVVPDEDEIRENNRARSARLRMGIRI